MDFNEPGIRAITFSLVSVATALTISSLLVGLYSTTSGNDPLARLRRLLGRVPASKDDVRLLGVSMLLNGACQMLVLAFAAVNLLGIFSSGAYTGYAPADTVRTEADLRFALTIVMAVAALCLAAGAYVVGTRVNYLTRGPQSAEPGLPQT